ncbi:MAG TPA: TetR/AcrR family transcriptional regulator [Motilibacteraceae bacterium]|nr:TetR/AcrR family transcriptional regulator [Motilibacteraceae bacterium]
MNQKQRTRRALLQAAAELVREGASPSIPAAAERALVSVATAYRYFSSAEDLWWEASTSTYEQTVEQSAREVERAGTDPQARLEALLRSTGFPMLDDQLPYRRVAKNALEQWFRQQAAADDERVPVRQGRRNDQIRAAIAPLADQLPGDAMDRLTHALGLLVGTEPVISLIDAIGLDVPEAKQTLLDAARWMLSGALAELSPPE